MDGPVHLVRLIRPREAGHEHAHPREERADEDHHDEEDLPRHADGGIPGVAHVVAHHGVIDDALNATDDVLEHRGPGELPHRAADRPLHDGPIESLGLLCAQITRSDGVRSVAADLGRIDRHGSGGRPGTFAHQELPRQDPPDRARRRGQRIDGHPTARVDLPRRAGPGQLTRSETSDGARKEHGSHVDGILVIIHTPPSPCPLSEEVAQVDVERGGGFTGNDPRRAPPRSSPPRPLVLRHPRQCVDRKPVTPTRARFPTHGRNPRSPRGPDRRACPTC